MEGSPGESYPFLKTRESSDQGTGDLSAQGLDALVLGACLYSIVFILDPANTV